MLRSLIAVILLALASTSLTAQDVNPVKTRFAWGAEVGSSIDLSGYDMSSVDFNASVGLSRSWLSFAGVGAGACIMASNSCRSYPLFAVFRTDFSRRKQLLFMDVRGGVSLNYLARNVSQTGAYAALNIGINLATGRTFRSYALVGYTFVDRRDVWEDEYTFTTYKPVSYATVKLGVAF